MAEEIVVVFFGLSLAMLSVCCTDFFPASGRCFAVSVVAFRANFASVLEVVFFFAVPPMMLFRLVVGVLEAKNPRAMPARCVEIYDGKQVMGAEIGNEGRTMLRNTVVRIGLKGW